MNKLTTTTRELSFVPKTRTFVLIDPRTKAQTPIEQRKALILANLNGSSLLAVADGARVMVRA